MTGMSMVVTRLKQQGLDMLGSLHPENYDESTIEEFYFDAEFKHEYDKKGSALTAIMSSVSGQDISINRELLKNI